MNAAGAVGLSVLAVLLFLTVCIAVFQIIRRDNSQVSFSRIPRFFAAKRVFDTRDGANYERIRIGNTQFEGLYMFVNRLDEDVVFMNSVYTEFSYYNQTIALPGKLDYIVTLTQVDGRKHAALRNVSSAADKVWTLADGFLFSLSPSKRLMIVEEIDRNGFFVPSVVKVTRPEDQQLPVTKSWFFEVL